MVAALLCAAELDPRAAHGGKHKKDQTPPRPAITASQPPAFSIPVDTLGFSPPGPVYAGQRVALVSLDFLDDQRLLFTFRAPGLLTRAANGDDVHNVRALVLHLPSGTIDAEALLTVHGDEPYLLRLNDGTFLLRDGNMLRQGDATLALKPVLRFPGSLTLVAADPDEQLLVTDSYEPSDTKPVPQTGTGAVSDPATASADVTTDPQVPAGAPSTVIRILRRDTGKVMLVSRVRETVHLPINHEAYLEALRGSGHKWVLNETYFTGESRMLATVDSTCMPLLSFVTASEFLAQNCAGADGLEQVAGTTEGKILWHSLLPPTQVWPRFVVSPGGTRIVRESLAVNHPIDAYTPLDLNDVTGQLVEVLDALTGTVLLKAPANPVLDGGGNVAVSPSGRFAAVLNGSAVDVYAVAPTAPK